MEIGWPCGGAQSPQSPNPRIPDSPLGGLERLEGIGDSGMSGFGEIGEDSGIGWPRGGAQSPESPMGDWKRLEGIRGFGDCLATWWCPIPPIPESPESPVWAFGRIRGFGVQRAPLKIHFDGCHTRYNGYPSRFRISTDFAKGSTEIA